MASETNKDDNLLIGKFADQANMSYNRNIPVFSAFLNLNEQNILEQARLSGRFKTSFSTICLKTDGGYEMAERKLAVFLPKPDYFYSLPIKILKIEQVDKRFSKDLGHRDFLGAILNLGIDRSLIGDIVLADGIAYCFCLEKIADYISDNLTKVRNDFIRITVLDEFQTDFTPSYTEIVESVASVRLDALISAAFNESRTHSVNYIQEGLVFVNGKLISTNAYNLKDGDIVSVRKKGRFKYVGIRNESKKGRYFVILHKY